MHGILHFDGGARPTNPGHAAFACVVDKEDGTSEVLSRYIGWKTNNEAEYYGFIVGVKFAYHVGVRELEIVSDSKLVINQVLGDWQVKQENLKPLCKDARNVLQQYFPSSDACKLYWDGREANAVADDLCTRAINWGRNLNPVTLASIKRKRPGEQVDPFRRHPALSHALGTGRVRDKALSAFLSSLS